MDTAITVDDISPQVVSSHELEKVLKFLNDINVSCTLFVIPKSGDSFSWNEDFVKALELAVDLGHELALHGYRHVKNEFGYIVPFPLPRYEKQKKLIEKGRNCLKELCGQEMVGFRAPNYRFNKATLKALSDLNFLYDSSKTVFKPTGSIRCRVRTFNHPKAHSVQGLVEIPVTGDYIYALQKRKISTAVAKAIDDFEWVSRQKGAFVVNNHIQHLDVTGLTFLYELTRRLSSKTNFVRLEDLASNLDT